MTRTRTEERLSDALLASADRVREDRLRPLPTLEPAAGLRARRRAAWRAWLVPAAAAASVALVIGLAVAVTGVSYRASGEGPGVFGSAAGVPKYFADFASTYPPDPALQVRSTSTGSVVASIPPLKVPGWSLSPNAAGASPDGRTFYFAYQAFHQAGGAATTRIWIYQVRITSSGAATPPTMVKGGDISGLTSSGTGGSMAVSPDGTRLALTADTTTPTSNTQGGADQIIVIDMATGARRVWRGGLYRSGKTFAIPDISWTADGRSLVFLGLWCDLPESASPCGGTPGLGEYRDTQVRSLSVGTGGGTLDRSTVLLTQSARYPVIAAAVAGPDPSELNVVVLSGQPDPSGSWPEIAVDRVSAVSGALLGVAYDAATVENEGRGYGALISADPSGRYLLLTYDAGPAGTWIGWLGAGKMHRLLIRQPYPGAWITAW
jgi:hypothetical protein